MLNLTRKVDYGMLLLTHLGLHPGQAFSARQIANQYSLSPSLTANVLKGLQKGKLVTSTRGVHGGYLLNRSPEEISLSSVIEILEGYWNVITCESVRDGTPPSCATYPVCLTRPFMRFIETEIRQVFDQATLKNFIDEARKDRGRGNGAQRQRDREDGLVRDTPLASSAHAQKPETIYRESDERTT